MDRFKLRCRRCRCVVLVSDDVVNTHGQPVKETSCSSISTSSVWFVSMENEELSWIREAINSISNVYDMPGSIYTGSCFQLTSVSEARGLPLTARRLRAVEKDQGLLQMALWIKGKLNCPKCNSRLGSFDFVKSAHCPCGDQTLPGVYILRDRVDKMLLKQAQQQQDFHTRFARSDSPLIKEASVDPQGTSCQECTEGSRMSGKTQRHPAATLPQGCDPAGLLDESDTQGQGGCSGTAGLVLRKPRTDLQLCVSVTGVDQCLTPSAGELDRLFSNDVRGKSHQICLVCVDSRHRRSGIDPAGASENHVNVSRTVVRHVCNHGNKISKCSGFGDRCSGTSQMALFQEKNDNGCYVQPKRRKKELRSTRRKKLRSKQLGGEHVDDSDEERLDSETLNRFKHLEEEQSSSDDSIIDENVSEEHECPVCLDMFFRPHVCRPCGHMFCETCLRHLAHESDNSTAFPCPMCRILIKSCHLDRDLTATIKLKYPVSYKHRRMSDSKYLSHRYPLPRSTGPSNRHTFNERIVYAMGGNENIYTLMSRVWLKCFTFLGAVILVLLVLCVSLTL